MIKDCTRCGMTMNKELIELEVIEKGIYVDVGVDKDDIVYLIRK